MVTAAALERRRKAGIGKRSALQHAVEPVLSSKLASEDTLTREDSFRGFDTVQTSAPKMLTARPPAASRATDDVDGDDDDYDTVVDAPLFANPLSPSVVPPLPPLIDRVPTVIKATRLAPKPKPAAPPAPSFVMQRPPTTKRPSRPVGPAAPPALARVANANAAPARGATAEPVYGNFNIIIYFGPFFLFSIISQLCADPGTPCDVLYLAPMPIEC